MFYEVNESLRIGTDSTTCLQSLLDCSLERFKLKSNYNRRGCKNYNKLLSSLSRNFMLVMLSVSRYTNKDLYLGVIMVC